MNPLVFNLLLALSCLYALWRGGGPERVCAIAFLAATGLTVIAVRSGNTRFHSIEFGVLAVDLALLAVLVALAVTANRLWPMLMAAMQLVEVATHFARASPVLAPWAYATMLALWSYPMLALLALATWRHGRRIARTGPEPAWTGRFAPR